MIVTIIDVNDFAPEFPPPWTKDRPWYELEMLEGLPPGTLVGAFTATDRDSNIASYELLPSSMAGQYFVINNATGNY